MSDDAALLLRVSLFGLVAGVAYWFVSYEWLGTVALLVLAAGPGSAALILLRHRRGQQGVERQSRREMLRRFAGVPSSDPPGPRSLEDENVAVLPGGSLWPFAASLGLAVALSGLIFGLWLVIVGLSIALYSARGWVAAVIRETRYGHVASPDRSAERQEGESQPASGGPEQPTLRRR